MRKWNWNKRKEKFVCNENERDKANEMRRMSESVC